MPQKYTLFNRFTEASFIVFSGKHLEDNRNNKAIGVFLSKECQTVRVPMYRAFAVCSGLTETVSRLTGVLTRKEEGERRKEEREVWSVNREV